MISELKQQKDFHVTKNVTDGMLTKTPCAKLVMNMRIQIEILKSHLGLPVTNPS